MVLIPNFRVYASQFHVNRLCNHHFISGTAYRIRACLNFSVIRAFLRFFILVLLNVNLFLVSHKLVKLGRYEVPVWAVQLVLNFFLDAHWVFGDYFLGRCVSVFVVYDVELLVYPVFHRQLIRYLLLPAVFKPEKVIEEVVMVVLFEGIVTRLNAHYVVFSAVDWQYPLFSRH